MLTRRFFFIATVLALTIVLTSFYWPGSMLKVTPDALMKLIGEGEAPVIVDVRTKVEFESGHLPRAMHVSLFSLFSEHENLAISQQENVIVYCGTGFRARLASMILKAAGFDSVYLLKGQLKGWKRSGYPVMRA